MREYSDMSDADEERSTTHGHPVQRRVVPPLDEMAEEVESTRVLLPLSAPPCDEHAQFCFLCEHRDSTENRHQQAITALEHIIVDRIGTASTHESLAKYMKWFYDQHILRDSPDKVWSLASITQHLTYFEKKDVVLLEKHKVHLSRFMDSLTTKAIVSSTGEVDHVTLASYCKCAKEFRATLSMSRAYSGSSK